MGKTVALCVVLLLIVALMTSLVGCCNPFRSAPKTQEIIIDNGQNEVVVEGENGANIRVKIR